MIVATLIISGIRSLWYTDILVSSILTKGTLVFMFGTYGKDLLYLMSIPVIYFTGLGFLLINMYFLSFYDKSKYKSFMFKLTFILFGTITFSFIIMIKLIDVISSGNHRVIEYLGIYHIWLFLASISFYTFSIITIYSWKKLSSNNTKIRKKE